jgi:hypothetical protein
VRVGVVHRVYNSGGKLMKYRIADLDTGRVWYSEDDAEAIRLSYEHDRYDIEILTEAT